MKHSMLSEERRRKIVDLVRVKHQVTVADLCQRCQVSAGTIRQDLSVLDQRGLLQRTHGGAVSLNRRGFEPLADEKQILHQQEKQVIASLALTLIHDGDTLVLDTGTTTLALARLLSARRQLTVVTNDLAIALELEAQTDITVILTGGLLRRQFHCTIGPAALASLADLRVDHAFLAANGVSQEDGLTTPNLDMADLKRAFLTISREAHLLCDSSKSGRTSFVRYASLNEIHTLITDDALSGEEKRTLAETGVRLMIAPISE